MKEKGEEEKEKDRQTPWTMSLVWQTDPIMRVSTFKSASVAAATVAIATLLYRINNFLKGNGKGKKVLKTKRAKFDPGIPRFSNSFR